MRRHLFTIGHSDHSIDRFIELLKKYSINVLCDVRSSPYSKRFSHFDREQLKVSLLKNGIKYVFLGEELGGRPKDLSCYVDGRVDYVKQSKTSLFNAGLERLVRGVEDYTPAIMCSEKDPITCHRMLLIAKNLRFTDIDIDHILPNGALETQQEAEQRMMDACDIRPDLFFNRVPENDLIEKAYRIQGERMAYHERVEAQLGPYSQRA